MKISCQSCQAKYTIADEKVLGKIVKIRCKKCGATIVINGSETEGATQAFEAPQAAASGAGAFDYASGGGGDSWTVNVADGDQRTMTTAEITAGFQSHVVTEETFCWKDGMGDWLPIREIPEIMTALSGAGGHAPQQDHSEDATAIGQSPAQQPQAPAPQAGFSSLFGGGGSSGSSNGSPLFGGGDPAPVQAAPAPAAAARRAGGRGGGGADLFGAAATAGGEEDVMTSAAQNPQMVPGGDKRTGERNENSVLFSLNALTQSAPEPKGMAQGDGSGLIDIRALGQTMAKDTGPSHNKVDDIMNLSGGGAFSAALAAPVLAPPPSDMPEVHGGQPPQKSSMGLIIGLIGGFAVLGIIIVAALFVLRKPQTNIGPIATASVANTSTAADTATTTAPLVSVATADPTAPTTSAQRPGVGVSGTAPRNPTNNGNPNPTPNPNPNPTPNPNPNPTPNPNAGTGKCGCKADDFACNMACESGVKQTTPVANNNTGGSAPFDRGQAASALGGIASNLSSCKKGDGPTGQGHVKVTFAPNGTVQSVDVDNPPFAGTSVGGCIAGKFRGAKVPPFSGGAVAVGKSFSLN